MGAQELRRQLGCGEICRLIEDLTGVGQGGDHHSVPGSNHLVVRKRSWTPGAGLHKSLARSGQLFRRLTFVHAKALRRIFCRVPLVQHILSRGPTVIRLGRELFVYALSAGGAQTAATDNGLRLSLQIGSVNLGARHFDDI